MKKQQTGLVHMAKTAIERASQITEEEKQLLMDSVCQGATETEFRVFMAVCNRVQLDPFARQIYAIKRWDSAARRESISYQTSVDGFRLIAERTGNYHGQTPPQWCGPDGKWVDVWLSDTPPAGARCGVRRSDWPEPLYQVAAYRSYVALTKDKRPAALWASKPDVMLHKCAESLALRKAFPQELSGLYTQEEMGDAGEIQPEQGRVVDAPPMQPRPQERDTRREMEAAIEACNSPAALDADVWRAVVSAGLAEDQGLRAVFVRRKRQLLAAVRNVDTSHAEETRSPEGPEDLTDVQPEEAPLTLNDLMMEVVTADSQRDLETRVVGMIHSSEFAQAPELRAAVARKAKEFTMAAKGNQGAAGLRRRRAEAAANAEVDPMTGEVFDEPGTRG